ncbi:probable NOT transcription complex subunit VIP2 isoform X1 [Ipomoea triloba]|uniref:probable NOT transcription complex subunit VIP2 isoform X1 n=2 Tax=Ipomoea triloba TaxID=35885 RepID=UPI00125D1C0F|nr:probable NOT transcription complex subunit VIP2 isoform X1 [Ipomoea triloba]XP_031099151.1 probable NOT transcription complex subunit VIP2 isoform X1 [Ipomoea triloba]XP_031099152.1 probable NOT transcription complex subunit VIP2 isoform X1 [Ipomoea triloba]
MSGLLNSGLNGSASNLPETTARALATSFSAQSGSTATVLNHSGGTVQSLQGIHGNFNMSNVHGTFASRNSAMTGGPSGSVQQAGNVSNGRFSINNIPTVLSQLSLASSHGHSGATNIGGRIANSMTNIVSGSNIGRGLSADGGSNMHGVASRINLTAPQMVSMLGNSYSGAGVPLLQNQFQAGNSHLASMALLNEYNARDNATFDINDFPQLGGRPPSAGGSQGQLGFIRKPNIGFSQQNQEFSIQNEDFPALPGFKGQKDQLQESMASMMQSQHLAVGRSSGFSFGGNYSSHQPQQQQASSTNGSGISFPPANYQDARFHGPEARTMGPPSTGSGSSNLSNLGPYDQLLDHYQPFQRQSQFRSISPFRDQDLKPLQASQAADRFGMFGLLNVIKMTNPALSTLALGVDLTSLGLNLNSVDNLHKTFASPWSDEPAKGEPEYTIPECYNAKQSPALKQSYFSKFRPETLFYIFYSMPKEEAQLYAANELHVRGWFYHRELRLWFTRVTNIEPLVKTATYERGCYFCFDPNTWEVVRKDNFVLQYEMIEKVPVLP